MCHKVVEIGNSAFTHMKISFQANGARERGDGAESGEEECGDEREHRFLLPGDEGFEGDRPTRRGPREDRGGAELESSANKRLMYKDVARECDRLAVESDGESDCVSVQKRGPPKKRVRNAKILGDDSDSDSDSDSESENDF